MITIVDAASDAEFNEARRLFEEYAAGLGVDLSFQDFTHELENIREVYGPPRGCLLLATRDGVIVGCVAFRPFAENACEMKRMYVRPAARGMNIGRRLAVELIDRARAAGYRKMVLDTLVTLQSARELYRSLGFREIQPYYANPLEGVIYMELDFD